MVLSPGQVVAGKYKIERELGTGGMGVVYTAENVVLQKRVALKVMHRGGLQTTAADISRFMREGVAASQVKHSGIVEVYDAGEDYGMPWMAMELLDGESLQDRLDRDRVLPVPQTLDIACEVLSALSAVHERGIIHRDIKPANIFLTDTPKGIQPKLLDFGIAKLASKTRLTADGAMLGTAHFMAPEQFLDSAKVDARSDIYAIGAVLYLCLSGTVPFQACSIVDLFQQQQSSKPREILTAAPDLPHELARIVHWCLGRDPDARPQTVSQLRSAIESFVTNGAAFTGDSDDATAALPLANNEPVQQAPTIYPSGGRAFHGSSAGQSPVGVQSAIGDQSAVGVQSAAGVQRTVALPPPVSGGQPAPPPPARAGMSTTKIVILILVLGFVGLLFTVGPFVVVLVLGILAATGGLDGEHIQWNSNKRPLFIDTNGDGATDVIGWVRVRSGFEFPIHMAAFDGRTGELLWTTPELTDEAGALESRAAVAGGRLLVVDEGATLSAYDLDDGEVSWTAALGERVSEVCTGPQGQVMMILASEQRRLVSVVDGRITTVPDARPCPSRLDGALGAGGSWDMAAGRHLMRAEHENLTAPGMTIEQAWSELGSTSVVAFGNRAMGTEVPMIAVFHSGTRGLLWSSDVPAGNALRADDSLPAAVAIGVQRVVVAYDLVDDTWRLTAFDLRSGRRLWDGELPDENYGVRDMEIEGGRVFVSHRTWLDVFDLENGARQYRIGRWR